MELGIDLDIYFKKYQELMSGVDQVFNKMKADYPEEVLCDNGCTECCYALFDLSLVEALYLNARFSELEPDQKNTILIDADKADRKVNRIKKNLFKKHQQGADEQKILWEASREKVRCPLLIDNRCVLYEHRPVTCRLYGIPMQMGETSASCSKSGFEPGNKYPTVHMDRIHDRLISLSQEVALALNSKYPHLHTMLVPVSMCLLTEYSREYLGAEDNKDPAEESGKASENNGSPAKEWVLGPRE